MVWNGVQSNRKLKGKQISVKTYGKCPLMMTKINPSETSKYKYNKWRDPQNKTKSNHQSIIHGSMCTSEMHSNQQDSVLDLISFIVMKLNCSNWYNQLKFLI